MPKPVQLSYTDDKGQQKKVDSFVQIAADADLEFGFVPFNAPGIGEGNFVHNPQDILDRQDKDKCFRIFTGVLQKLQAAMQQPANNSALQTVKAEICLSAAHQYYFTQFIAVNGQLSVAEKQEIFNVLCDQMGLDIRPVVMLAQLKKQYLPQALQYLGAKLANYNCAGFPLTFSFCNGNQLGDVELNNVKMLWAAGANPNQQHPQYGTFVHYLIANELQELAVSALDELAKKNTSEVYDFSARDSEGKTLLLVAVKTRQVAVIKKLLELHRVQKMDIGLDIPDNQGRTALMLAAALGSLVAFSLLTKAGADIKKIDFNGNNLSYFEKAPRDEVINILRSIHIEPERDNLVTQNWLPFNDPLARPVTNNFSEEPHKRVLLSLAPNHAKVLRAALMDALTLQDDMRLYKSYITRIRDLFDSAFSRDKTKFKTWLNYGIDVAPRSTVLDACLAGQELIRGYVERESSSKNPDSGLKHKIM